MIRRFYPTKDTTITNAKSATGTPMTGSNLGGSEILDVFVVGAVSGVLNAYATASQARALLQFNTTYIGELTSSKEVTQNATWNLVLRNAEQAETLPSSYTLEIAPVSSSWDEGNGVDNVDFYDAGYANWVRRKSDQQWTLSGSDYLISNIITFSVDTGYEDVRANVSTYVTDWLANTYPNNGLIVKITSSLETGFIDYYKKSFHSRTTKFKNKRPCLEAIWDDSISDDRKNFYFNNTGSLYLYYSIDGILTDIPGLGTGNDVITVAIKNSGTLVTSLSGSHTGKTGVYSASFAVPTSASYSGTLFNDVWHLNNVTSYYTGSFIISSASFYSSSLSTQRYNISVRNLKNQYTVDDKERLEMYVRRTGVPQHVYPTASINTSGQIIKNMYYRIDDDSTGETIIPFATGSIKYTKLSYGEYGNYFDFHMSTLSPGKVYRLLFLIDREGQQVVYDNGFKFRVN